MKWLKREDFRVPRPSSAWGGAFSVQASGLRGYQAIEARRLYSLGIGVIDAHLIASVFVNAPAFLRTRDKPLPKVAEALGCCGGLAACARLAG